MEKTNTSLKVEIVKIPVDFYTQFKNNPDDSIRDILGVPTVSIKPLFKDSSKVLSCVDMNYINPLDEKSLSLLSSFMPEDNEPVYMHLDGSEGGDGYGISMGKMLRWTEEEPPLPVIKILFMGIPSKKTYGKDFREEFVEYLFQEIIDRGFNLKLLSYDRATVITVIRRIVEPTGTIVAPLSIDQCANFPTIDYDKTEPPFFKSITTKGQYDIAMVEFERIVNRIGVVVPYHEAWYNIPYAFEHDIRKRRVIKVSGQNDDLGQTVAGTVFNILNNEKSIFFTGEKDKKEWDYSEQPDMVEMMLKKMSIDAATRITRPSSGNFDKVPDEMEVEDDMFDDLDNFRRLL